MEDRAGFDKAFSSRAVSVPTVLGTFLARIPAAAP